MVENIWAVGDVTDRICADARGDPRGRRLRRNRVPRPSDTPDHENVASAVFSQPPLGVVGLTEAQARHGGREIDIYRSVFRPMKSTFYGGKRRMLVKLVVEQESGRVLGGLIAGPDAPEMIQMAAIAVKLGVTKAQWDEACARPAHRGGGTMTMREPYVALGLSHGRLSRLARSISVPYTLPVDHGGCLPAPWKAIRGNRRCRGGWRPGGTASRTLEPGSPYPSRRSRSTWRRSRRRARSASGARERKVFYTGSSRPGSRPCSNGSARHRAFWPARIDKLRKLLGEMDQ